jgi:hypothetical protein
MPEETDYKKLYEATQKKISLLEDKVKGYEGPGKAKLYYALNRQLSDLADMINSKSLKSVDISDGSDKSIEKMKIIWGAVKSLSEILPLLAQSAGLTGNEDEDLKRPFIETVAERRT